MYTLKLFVLIFNKLTEIYQISLLTIQLYTSIDRCIIFTNYISNWVKLGNKNLSELILLAYYYHYTINISKYIEVEKIAEIKL